MAFRSCREPFRALLILGLVSLGCERAPDGPRTTTVAPPSATASAAPAPAPTPTPTPAPATSVVPSALPAPEEATASPERDPRMPGTTRDGSASSVSKSKDGLLHIAGQDRRARHTHGGAPARVGNVTFVITNDGQRARRVTAKSADFLRDKGCEAPPSTVVSHPQLSELIFEDDDDPRGSTLTLEIPARSSRAVRVGFASVEAYYVYCDRFAIRVQFSVDERETLAVTSELAVMRVTPVGE